MSYSASIYNGKATFSISGTEGDESERRIKLGFNPGDHVPTAKIKGFCAVAAQAMIRERDAITDLHRMLTAPTKRELDAFSDAMRNFAIALTHLEAASMFAISGLHARTNAGLDS